MSLIEKALPPLTAGKNILDSLGNVLDLGIRLYLAKVFFLSGLTKIRDWDTTLALFQEEYHVPVVPPELAAFMGTAGELVLPVFLTLGLATRLAAFGLTFTVAALSFYFLERPFLALKARFGTPTPAGREAPMPAGLEDS